MRARRTAAATTTRPAREPAPEPVRRPAPAQQCAALLGAALLGAALLALAGCSPAGRSDPAGPAGPSGAPSPAVSATGAPSATGSPATAPPASGDPAPGETLVRVSRSGGYAGRTHTVVVRGDGSWTRLDGAGAQEGSGTLAPQRLAALSAALREADLPRLPRVSKGSGTVYDGFTYAFAHGGVEVAAEQEAVPPALRKVLDALPPFTPA
ncbi:hypothetical protein GCM10010371_16080 [Streptomyces subrutilus]|uniref:Uncharacterized protein n=1 Tax=Streptomyces subrutilus TaxID=36818 RepID=A0A918V1V0_9ACTN|nr:hypothetical protein [Streptomyces subrutilus]GGZ57465.1 hypothetical protein GCM10010371_16080 [Streptomyces subrutilus]